MHGIDNLVNQMRDALSKSEVKDFKQQEVNSDVTYKINKQKGELIETRKEL